MASKSGLQWPQTGGDSEPVRALEDPYPSSLVDDARGDDIDVPLMAIAHARSGDKGDTANIGLIGRSGACYAWLRDNVTSGQVREWFQGVVHGEVHRYLVPNLLALNFLLDESLGGGGTVSLFTDAQGKTYGQALLRCRVTVPSGLLDTIADADRPTSSELA